MLPSGTEPPAANILDADFTTASAPLPEEVLRAIEEGMPTRSPEAIRSDRPPSLRGHQWQRADGEGWNLWRVLETPKGKQTQFIGQLPYDQWQMIKESYLTRHGNKPVRPIPAGLDPDPGDGGTDPAGPAGGGSGSRRRSRRESARPSNVFPLRPATERAEKLAGKGPAGWKRSRVRAGWLIRRIGKHNLVESEYGVSYLYVLSRRPDRTDVDRAKYPLSGFYNWRALEAAQLLTTEVKNNEPKRARG